MHRIPKHIGIIPDGNRRWAKQHGLRKQDGYAYGLKPGLDLLQAAKKHGVRELTYYGFTVDNCKRPKEQVTAFSCACVEAVHLLEQAGAAIQVIGNTASTCFPKELLPYVSTGNAPEPQTGLPKVNLLVNYGWEWDMKNNWATKHISRIDMVIRWGGMRRLSGFLPLQSVYADFYTIDALWPDYEETQFDGALAWYQKQDITLGG